MATTDPVRERQEQILSAFQGQPDAPMSLVFPEAIELAVEQSIAALTSASDEQGGDGQRSSATLPPPSEAARDFILRALANQHFRELIARLADE